MPGKNSPLQIPRNVIPEEYSCSFPQMAGLVRACQTVNKALIYAVIDGEGDITYYQIDRVKM